ncbi:MAG: PKD domain-containing protein [Bacteroidota bacterium]|nr:PKD domain-containing protein [Bacteroidota bacterium]
MILLLQLVTLCRAQLPYLHLPMVDGSVNAIMRSGDTMYIGGRFNHLYYADSAVKYATQLDTIKGLLVPGMPKFNGPVYSMLADSNGGYLLSGAFTKVDDSMRIGVVHIDDNFRVTSKWAGVEFCGGPVGGFPAFKLWRNNTVYLYANYASFGGGIKKSSAACISPTTSNTSGNMPLINNAVNCVTADAQGTFYIAGSFTMAGDSARKHLARVDNNGKVYNWKAEVNGPVSFIRLCRNKVFIAGAFSKVNGLSRNGFAVLDTNGNLQSWNLDLAAGQQVLVLEPAGDTMYVGGEFTSIGLVAAGNFAAINVNTGSLYSTAISLNARVNSICIVGSSVYLGGWFTTINSSNRKYHASLNRFSWTLNTWHPFPSNTGVYALASDGLCIYIAYNLSGNICRIAQVDLQTNTIYPGFISPVFQLYASITSMQVIGTNIYLLGTFWEISNYYRPRFAVINKNNGTVQNNIRVGVNKQISCLAPGPGGTFFVGSLGTKIGGTVRTGLAAMNAATGNLLTWEADINGQVNALSSYSNTIFAGGNITDYAGSNANYLLNLNMSTAGLSTTHTFSTNDIVRDIQLSGQQIFFGGGFTSVGSNASPSVTRKCVASFNVVNGIVSTLNKNISINALTPTVTALLIVGNMLYIGGDFNGVDATTALMFAKININTNLLLSSWKPIPAISSCVPSRMLYNEGKIYIVHSPNCWSTEGRNYLTAIDTLNGNMYPWNPAPDPLFNYDVLLYNKKLIAIGGFRFIGLPVFSCLAALNIRTGAILNYTPSLAGNNDELRSMDIRNGKLYIAGSFNNIGGYIRYNMAEINTANGSITTWSPYSNKMIKNIKAASKVFVCGDLDSLGGTKRNRVGAIRYDGSIDPWNARVNNDVYDFTLSGNRIYLAGNFTQVDFNNRYYFAGLDTVFGNIVSGFGTAMLPAYNGSYRRIRAVGQHLYVNGGFNGILNTAKPNLGRLDRDNAAVGSFNLNVNAYVTLASFDADKLYISGEHTSICGENVSSGLNAVDTIRGSLFPWYPRPNMPIEELVSLDTMIVIGGGFDSVSNYYRKGLCFLPKPYFRCDSLNKNSFCVGDSIHVFYSVAANFTHADTIYIELSDSAGNFLNSTRCGYKFAVAHVAMGKISGRIPGFILPGGNYRARLLNATPFMQSTVSALITIFPKPNPQIHTQDSQMCFYNNNFILADITAITPASRKWILQDLFTSTDSAFAHHFDSARGYTAILAVTNSFGCADTARRTLEVFSMPRAIIWNADSQLCAGSSLLLADSSTISTGQLTRKWTFGDGDSAMSVVYNKHYGTAGNYLVKLLSVSAHQCKDSSYRNIRVFDKPQAKFAMQGNATCANNNLIQLYDSTVLQTGTYTRLWHFGDQTTDTTRNPEKSFSTHGIYNIALTIMDNHHCADTSNKTIVISAKPGALIATNYTTACLNNNLFMLDDTAAVNTGDTIRRLWISGNDSTSVKSPVYHFSSTGMHVIKLFVMNQRGCADTAATTVQVFAEPRAQFTINKTSQCLTGNAFVFTDSSNAYSRDWKINTYDTASAALIIRTFNTTGSIPVLLCVKSAEGCKDSILHTVLINPNPKAGFTVNNPKQCLKGNVFLLSDTTSVSPAYQRIWDFNDGDTSSAPNCTKSYPLVNYYYIQLKVITVAGCSDSIGTTVQTLRTPEWSMLAVPANVGCIGDTVTLHNGNGNPKTSVHFWSFNDVPIANHPDSFLLCTQSGNYRFIVSDTNNCTDTSQYLTVTFHDPSPVGVITGALNVNKGQVTTYIVPQHSLSTYGWHVVNGIIMSGDGSNTITVQWGNTNGAARVAVLETNSFGCQNDSAYIIVQVLPGAGLQQLEVQQFLLMPNPSNGLFKIESSSNIPIERVRMIDARGSYIQTFEVHAQHGQIDLRGLVPGIYLAEVVAGQARTTLKIVIRD